MNPKTVLRINTDKEAAEAKREWLKAYAEIAAKYPEKKELTELLSKRVEIAYIDVIAGKEDDAELCGDFPLGNAFDAEFMTPFFQIDKLALMQCGLHSLIKKQYYVEPAYDILVRNGILSELEGDYKEAARYYNGDSYSMMVDARMRYCLKKLEEQK